MKNRLVTFACLVLVYGLVIGAAAVVQLTEEQELVVQELLILNGSMDTVGYNSGGVYPRGRIRANSIELHAPLHLRYGGTGRSDLAQTTALANRSVGHSVLTLSAGSTRNLGTRIFLPRITRPIAGTIGNGSGCMLVPFARSTPNVVVHQVILTETPGDSCGGNWVVNYSHITGTDDPHIYITLTNLGEFDQGGFWFDGDNDVDAPPGSIEVGPPPVTILTSLYGRVTADQRKTALASLSSYLEERRFCESALSSVSGLTCAPEAKQRVARYKAFEFLATAVGQDLPAFMTAEVRVTSTGAWEVR